MTLFLSTFAVIFIAELPDKTALASLVLATRYPVRAVILGAGLAFLVQTAVAVPAGALLTLLPERGVRVATGIGFLVFALMAWRRAAAKELITETAQVQAASARRRQAWVSSFLVVFAAEWGDLTQLATAALVARTGQPLVVGSAALAALWTVTVLAALVGSVSARVVSGPTLSRLSSGVLALVGGAIIVNAIRA